MTCAEQCRKPEPEGAESQPRPVVAAMPVLLYTHDQLMSVAVPDHPPRLPDDGACRCGACKVAALADRTYRFF
jgi:hypothetical protein